MSFCLSLQLNQSIFMCTIHITMNIIMSPSVNNNSSQRFRQKLTFVYFMVSNCIPLLTRLSNVFHIAGHNTLSFHFAFDFHLKAKS